MKYQIAFVGNLSNKDRNEWIDEINLGLIDVEILAFEHLNQEQKRAIHVAIVANPDPQQIAQLPNLKWVQSLWAGVERLVKDLPNATFNVSRMIDPLLSQTMAEAVLAWVLYLHREMPQYKQQQNEQIWRQRRLVETQKRRVGILGLGQLGLESAQKLYSNNFTVLGWGRSQKKINGIRSFCGEKGFKNMLQQSDILVCLLPLTPETRHLLNDESMGWLPKGACIINFSRGDIVDTDALLKLLSEDHLSHAVLDVFPVEPLPKSSPLWKSPDVTILPHIAAPTGLQSASKIVSANIMRYVKTGELPPLVNRLLGY